MYNPIFYHFIDMKGAAAPYGAICGRDVRIARLYRKYAPTPTAGLCPATPRFQALKRSFQYILLFACLLLSGCAYIQSPDIEQAVSEIKPVDDSWRCIFKDPLLVSLIEKALKNNADIRTACLNVVQAEATLKASRLSYLPSFSLGLEGGISKANGSSASNTYNIPVSMQWELNIAELIAKNDAAEASYLSASETVHAVQIQMISSIASHYYTLVSMDEQLTIFRQNTEIAQNTVDVMESLKEAGMMNEAAVSQAKTQYYSALAAENDMIQQIRTIENALKLLLGDDQNEISRASSIDQILPISCESSYPISLLADRPDVKAAEYELRARIADVDIARSAFYPTLNITASIGWTNNIGEIVNPGKFLFNAIGSLVQPLFNRGQSVAGLTIAKAEQEKALVSFNQALLTAGTELNDALNACQFSQARGSIRIQEMDAAKQAYEVSIELMQHGSGTYLEVLTSQSSLLQSRIAHVGDRLDVVQGQINLYKALGGSHDAICIDRGESQ